jgi:REP element-mobilizing transposase RayT
MSEKYKFYKGGLFFITLTIVGWIDIFTRKEYCDEIITNLNVCIARKGLRVYAFCIMPSHIHMVCDAESGEISPIMRDFKSYTAKQLLRLIQEHPQESRREWLLYLFRYFANRHVANSEFQVWQHGNHPISLESNRWIDQKIEYIHQNPVKAGLVNEAQNYIYSSANPDTALNLSVY